MYGSCQQSAGMRPLYACAASLMIAEIAATSEGPQGRIVVERMPARYHSRDAGIGRNEVRQSRAEGQGRFPRKLLPLLPRHLPEEGLRPVLHLLRRQVLPVCRDAPVLPERIGEAAPP